MAFLGSSTQGIAVIVFGMIEYTDDKVVFLTLSYTLRFDFWQKQMNENILLKIFFVLELLKELAHQSPLLHIQQSLSSYTQKR